MTERILTLLGLAHRAGKVDIGEEPVGAAARAKKARVVFTAADAAPSSARRAAGFADAGGCFCLELGADKDSLGRALGRTSVAMCAVTDVGFAAAIVKRLAQEDARYAAAAEALDLKARRASQRRQEALRHEKNRKKGGGGRKTENQRTKVRSDH